jgi:hypothetical protein
MSFNIYQKICTAFFLILIVFWVILFTSGARDGFYNYFFVFLYGLIPLFGGIAAMKGFYFWGKFMNAIGKAVFYIGLGLFLWGCGETVWAYYNFFTNVDIPYPSLADLFFAPSVFFYALGAIYLARTTADVALKTAFGKVFVIFAPAILFGISYYILIVVARGGVLLSEGGLTLKTALDILYPLGDFVALSVSVIVSGLSFKYLAGEYKADIMLILSGLATMFVADSIFSYTTTINTAYNGDLGDLVFTLAVFLLTCGVLGFNTLKNKPKVIS